MPVNERALMRRMKENYRAGGYKVGAWLEDGQEILSVAGGTWYVRLPLDEAGNELRALVVQHTGAMPGREVSVQKKTGAQLMVEGELRQLRGECLRRMGEERACSPTPLTLDGYGVWQDDAGRCRLFDPELTGIFALDRQIDACGTDGSVLRMQGAGRELLVMGVRTQEEQAAELEHLSGLIWVSGLCRTEEG